MADAMNAALVTVPAAIGALSTSCPTSHMTTPTAAPRSAATMRVDRFPRQAMATRHGVQSANVNRGELKLRSGPTIASVINAATTIVVNSVTAPITYVAGRLIASSALF
jgi:hypothetical protein